MCYVISFLGECVVNTLADDMQEWEIMFGCWEAMYGESFGRLKLYTYIVGFAEMVFKYPQQIAILWNRTQQDIKRLL